MLLPLHRLAQRYGMKAMNNRAGLLAALQPFTIDELGYAVQRVEALVTGVGSKVSSPFGLLVRWARSGDGSHFSPPTTPLQGRALLPAEVLVELAGGEPESELDPADSAAVTAMEADSWMFRRRTRSTRPTRGPGSSAPDIARHPTGDASRSTSKCLQRMDRREPHD